MFSLPYGLMTRVSELLLVFERYANAVNMLIEYFNISIFCITMFVMLNRGPKVSGTGAIAV